MGRRGAVSRSTARRLRPTRPVSVKPREETFGRCSLFNILFKIEHSGQEARVAQPAFYLQSDNIQNTEQKHSTGQEGRGTQGSRARPILCKRRGRHTYVNRARRSYHRRIVAERRRNWMLTQACSLRTRPRKRGESLVECREYPNWCIASNGLYAMSANRTVSVASVECSSRCRLDPRCLEWEQDRPRARMYMLSTSLRGRLLLLPPIKP